MSNNILKIKDIVSSNTDICITTAHVINDIKSFSKEFIGPHVISFYVNDINLVKPEGGRYDTVIAKDVIFCDAYVSSVMPSKYDDNHLVIINSDKIVITKLNYKEK